MPAWTPAIVKNSEWIYDKWWLSNNMVKVIKITIIIIGTDASPLIGACTRARVYMISLHFSVFQKVFQNEAKQYRTCLFTSFLSFKLDSKTCFLFTKKNSFSSNADSKQKIMTHFKWSEFSCSACQWEVEAKKG